MPRKEKEMDKEVFVLDSFALIAYLEEEPGAAVVRNLIKKAADKKCTLKLSAINWGEVYYNVARNRGREAADQWLILMEQLLIEVIDVDRSLIMGAALLKSKYALSYADCFAAALAQRENCPVLTGDKEFKQLSSVVKVQFLP